MTAQSAISADIGRDQAGYHAAAGAKGVFTFSNPANGFTAQLHSGVLNVSAGADTWAMSLEGFGYGGAIQSVGAASVTAAGNRVDSNYGSIDQVVRQWPARVGAGLYHRCRREAETG